MDYWKGTSYITLYPDMLKLRYANYPKDYFMGMLPSSQYGSVAVLNSSSSTAVITNNTSTSTRDATLNSDLSALSIRATEYLQRWKEVVQFSSKGYSDQMAAQFGIKAPEYMGNQIHFHNLKFFGVNINFSRINRRRRNLLGFLRRILIIL